VWDKGGLIFSFVVTFSGTLLCGRQKSTKTKTGHKIKMLDSATTKSKKPEIKPFTTSGISNCRPVGAGMLCLFPNSSVMGQVNAFKPSTAHTRGRCVSFLNRTS
jgi:hypothetical protein